MEAVGLVLGAIAGLAVGIFAGLKWGERLREQKAWRYWLANAVAMLVGMATVFGGLLLRTGFLWAAGIGMMGGGVTGLKYGYGKSVGVWRVADRLTGTDDLPKE